MLHGASQDLRVAARATHHARSQGLVLSSAEGLGTVRPLLFNRLTQQECARVLEMCEPLHAKRHSIVFKQGEPQKAIYLIVSGGVRVFYVSASGREVTRAYWFSGDFIGGPHVFGEMPHMWTAIATRDSTLLALSCGTLLTLCRDIPNLAIGLIEALSFKGRCYSAAAQLLGTRTPGERLAEVLTRLAERFAPTARDTDSVTVRITHEELAHMVCVTRQWVTSELKCLEERGVVSLTRGALHIRMDALRAAVASFAA